MKKYIKNDGSHVFHCWRRELQIWRERTLKQIHAVFVWKLKVSGSSCARYNI